MSLTIIVKVTDRCNLACAYCSYPEKKKFDLSLKNWSLIIARLREYINCTGEKNIKIIFHGGEPFLWPVKNYQYAFSTLLAELSEVEVKLGIQTNGTIVVPELLEMFKQYGVSIGISLDGPEQIHDSVRLDAGGTGSYARIQTFLKNLQNYELKGSFLAVAGNMHTGKEEQIWNFFREMGWPVRFNPLAPLGRGKKFSFAPGNYAEFLIRLYECILNDFSHFIKGFIAVDPLEKIMQKFLKMSNARECTFLEDCSSCFMGIDPAGNVYPCSRLIGRDEVCYGNINEILFSDLVASQRFPFFKNRSKILMENDCKGCEFFVECYGGCPATGINGDVYRKTIFCEDYKRLFKYLKKEGLAKLKERLVKELGIIKNSLDGLSQIKNKLGEQL